MNLSSLRALYDEIQINPKDERLWTKNIWPGPTQSEIASWQSQGYSVYQGKIRTVLSRDGRIQMLHSDRLTAFDRLIGYIPGKGMILTNISKFWFEQISKELPTHYLSSPGPRVLEVRDLRPIKVEVVVRAYLAGSLLRAYEKGEREFCGIRIPDGLKPWQLLPEPIITPTTKAAAFEHDENISKDALVKFGVCTEADWDQISTLALKVFSLGARLYGNKGYILVDTKYEFGKDTSGNVTLIDEVHTPDSSRLWIHSNYEERVSSGLAPQMLDKENVRRWLLDKGFTGYGDVPDVPRPVLIDLAKIYLGVAEALGAL